MNYFSYRHQVRKHVRGAIVGLALLASIVGCGSSGQYDAELTELASLLS